MKSRPLGQTPNAEPSTEPRLRVLIYTTLFPNSVQPLAGHFVLERMRHLISRADMKVIAPVPYFPPLNVNPRWFKLASVPRTETYSGFEMDHPRYVVLPRIGMATHGISMFMGSLLQTWRRLRAGDFDLIDAHYVYPDGFAAVLLGKLFGKPVVVSARGSDINLFPRFAAIRPLVRQVLKRADAVVAVSQSLKDQMVGLGCNREKITVIGNGVDPLKFNPRPQTTARQELGLPQNRPLVLSVGHLVELKGFHILIEAISKLRQRFPDVLLVIVGEGIFRAQIEKQIAELDLGNNVYLAGARPHSELSLWYSAADVFSLASSSEGWPNVALEAMACGKPVVATRVGSLPQIISSAAHGTLVDRGADAFERAIGDALDRKWDQNAIVRHARSHDWDSVADQLLIVYRNVLADRKSRSQN